MLVNVASNVGCYQSRTFFLRLKRSNLFVEGANIDSLLIVQGRPIDRTWQMIKSELAFTSGVNDGAVSAMLHWQGHTGHGLFGADRVHAHKTPGALLQAQGPPMKRLGDRGQLGRGVVIKEQLRQAGIGVLYGFWKSLDYGKPDLETCYFG